MNPRRALAFLSRLAGAAHRGAYQPSYQPS